jgi:hypothetical protein
MDDGWFSSKHPRMSVSRLELKPRWRSYGITEDDSAVAVS